MIVRRTALVALSCLAFLAPRLSLPDAPVLGAPVGPAAGRTVFLPYVAAPPVTYAVSARLLADGEPDLVRLDGDRAVVRLGDSIGVVEMRDGTAPRLLARSAPLAQGIYSLAARDGVVYASSSNDLLTFRVEGSELREVHRLPLQISQLELVAGPRHLLGWKGVQLILMDRATPDRPTLVGRLHDSSVPFGTLDQPALTESHVFYTRRAGSGPQLWAASIDGFPDHATLVMPQLQDLEGAVRLVAWGHHALVAEYRTGEYVRATIQDATAEGVDKAVARIDFAPLALVPMAVEGNRVDLILGRRNGSRGRGAVLETFLAQLDVTDARAPRVVARAPVPWTASDQRPVDDLRGGELLRRGDGTLWRYRLTGPETVQRTGVWRWRELGRLLAVEGHAGYFEDACEPGEAPRCLFAADLPATVLTRAGAGLPLPDAVQSLAVAPPLAYATVAGDAGSDVLVLDVSEPLHPRLVVSCPLATGRRLTVSQDLLIAFDFADPAGMAVAQLTGVELLRRDGRACPTPLSRISTPPVSGVTLDGGYLFATLPAEGIEVYDLTRAAQPRRLGRFDPLSPAKSVRTRYHALARDGHTGVVAVGDRGLLLVDLADPRGAPQLAVHSTHCVTDHVAAKDGLALVSCDEGFDLVAIGDPAVPRSIARGAAHGTVASGADGRFYVETADQALWELRALRTVR